MYLGPRIPTKTKQHYGTLGDCEDDTECYLNNCYIPDRKIKIIFVAQTTDNEKLEAIFSTAVGTSKFQIPFQMNNHKFFECYLGTHTDFLLILFFFYQ